MSHPLQRSSISSSGTSNSVLTSVCPSSIVIVPTHGSPTAPQNLRRGRSRFAPDATVIRVPTTAGCADVLTDDGLGKVLQFFRDSNSCRRRTVVYVAQSTAPQAWALVVPEI